MCSQGYLEPAEPWFWPKQKTAKKIDDNKEEGETADNEDNHGVKTVQTSEVDGDSQSEEEDDDDFEVTLKTCLNLFCKYFFGSIV